MLPNCWQIKKCGREKGGKNVSTLGICPAFPLNGHSCWVIAGTFCKGEVQGTFAMKEKMCIICEVYKQYSPSFGFDREKVKDHHPQEFDFCVNYLKKLKD